MYFYFSPKMYKIIYFYTGIIFNYLLHVIFKYIEFIMSGFDINLLH